MRNWSNILVRHYSPARAVAALSLVLGGLMRIAYVLAHHTELVAGEAFNVADAFARTGTLASPFLGDSGPTAHLLPLPILVGGLVYRLLGVGAPSAELLLSGWSIGLVLASFAMTAAAFRRAGNRVTACLLGLALCCGLPLNLGLEAITFRVWEGALAAALGAALLLALVTLDRAAVAPSWRAIIGLSAIAALLFLVSPQLGVAGYCSMALLFLRRVPARRWPASMLIGGLALVAAIGPWVLRNERTFGQPLLRSNFGLELSIAFHAGAVDSPDPRQAYTDRLRQVQPRSSWAAFHALQAAGGEVAYARGLGAETWTWMAAHPIAVLKIGARHIRQYLFPSLWMFQGNTPVGDHGIIPKAVASWVLAALGLIGLGRPFFRSPSSSLILISPMVLVTSVLFFIVQPILRYRYLIYAPMTFYAADAVVWLLILSPQGVATLARLEHLLGTSDAKFVVAPANI